MKKKQLFAGALAAAMMTASLAGCGGAASSAATSTTGGDTAGSTASADTNSGVVEVTIPSYKTGENAGAAFFVPQVERFNEKYAGKYKINLESVPQDSIFNDRLKQLAQQNKLPVLVEGGDPDWVKNVVIPNGLAYDLTDWIDATPAVKDVLIDDSREYCSNEDGRVMTMPLASPTRRSLPRLPPWWGLPRQTVWLWRTLPPGWRLPARAAWTVPSSARLRCRLNPPTICRT